MLMLQEYQNKINNQLEDIINRFSNNDCLGDAISYACLNGGKRLRPLLVVASGNMVNADLNHLLSVGVAIELIHCYSLIHDDLPSMDNDDLRRGLPTCHVKYGESIAILAGDALQSMAFELLSSNNFCINPQLKLNLINELAKVSGAKGMVGGQAIDILSINKHLSLDDLKDMHSAKTGKLISFSIMSGFLLGDETIRTNLNYELIHSISLDIGFLFQLIDDILDCTSSTQILGKTANKDQHHNKATFVTIYGLEATKQFASNLFGNLKSKIQSLPNNQLLLELLNFIYNRNN